LQDISSFIFDPRKLRPNNRMQRTADSAIGEPNVSGRRSLIRAVRRRHHASATPQQRAPDCLAPSSVRSAPIRASTMYSSAPCLFRRSVRSFTVRLTPFSSICFCSFHGPPPLFDSVFVFIFNGRRFFGSL
jgi:hypothetical protein